MSDVRVRFAPSPTGYLHVGGARTAIFNFLFARAVGGRFLLRIEDTDPVRSRGELSQVILDGLRWLGIESDEPVVYQSDHKDRFTEIARELIARGAAYPDFTTPDELEKLRRESQARREPMFRFKTDGEQARAEAPARIARGESYAVRFSALSENVAWDDLVHGPIEFRGDEIEDFVLLRSDGSPTYHLSVVCDDHDMGITHVLRGDDHVSNTPKQILLYRAMEWSVPRFGHVPLILGPDKQRLSKRTGATSVGEFRTLGFLPQALFNFLTLLGWSPGAGDRELFTRDDLISCFTLEGIQPKSAVFDIAKLEWMNGEHLRMLPDSDALDYLQSYAPSDATREVLERTWPLLKPRVRLPMDAFDDHAYFFRDPEEFDPKGVEKHFRDGAIRKALAEYVREASALPSFTAAALETHLRAFCEARELSAGKLIHPLRLALTGKTVSPGLFEMMEALGKPTSLRRMEKALETLASP